MRVERLSAGDPFCGKDTLNASVSFESHRLGWGTNVGSYLMFLPVKAFGVSHDRLARLRDEQLLSLSLVAPIARQQPRSIVRVSGHSFDKGLVPFRTVHT